MDRCNLEVTLIHSVDPFDRAGPNSIDELAEDVSLHQLLEVANLLVHDSVDPTTKQKIVISSSPLY